MRRIISFALALAIGVTAATLAGCNGSDNGQDDSLNPYLRAAALLKAGKYVSSPRGTKVYPEAGVTADEKELESIDIGLTTTFDKVRCNYPNTPQKHPGFDYAEWEVALFVSEVTPGGNVAFRVPCDGYCGTQYDQGGFIYAGGMVTGVVGDSYTISLPDVKLDKYDGLANGAEFEAEHWWLATVDAAKYEATKIHGIGQGHPIIPSCGGSLAPPNASGALTLHYDDVPSGSHTCILVVD